MGLYGWRRRQAHDLGPSLTASEECYDLEIMILESFFEYEGPGFSCDMV